MILRQDAKEKNVCAENNNIRAIEPLLKTSSPSLVAAKFSGFIFYYHCRLINASLASEIVSVEWF